MGPVCRPRSTRNRASAPAPSRRWGPPRRHPRDRPASAPPERPPRRAWAEAWSPRTPRRGPRAGGPRWAVNGAACLSLSSGRLGTRRGARAGGLRLIYEHEGCGQELRLDDDLPVHVLRGVHRDVVDVDDAGQAPQRVEEGGDLVEVAGDRD